MAAPKQRRRDEVGGSSDDAAGRVAKLARLAVGDLPDENALMRLQSGLEELVALAQRTGGILEQRLQGQSKMLASVRQELFQRSEKLRLDVKVDEAGMAAGEEAAVEEAQPDVKDAHMDAAEDPADSGPAGSIDESKLHEIQPRDLSVALKEENEAGKTNVNCANTQSNQLGHAERTASDKPPRIELMLEASTDTGSNQGLPIEALGLLRDQDLTKLDIKTVLGVASYPTQDLSDFLPGPIPDEDFTRAKPPNQIQLTTFTAFLEPYFRPFTEEDLSFLNMKSVGAEVVSYGRTISPYVIPPLGPLYTDVWAEEDVANPTGLPPPSPAPRTRELGRYRAKGTVSQLSDEIIEVGGVQPGPMTARLLSALLSEDDDEAPPGPTAASEIPPGRTRASVTDMGLLEERLRQELRFAGLVDMDMLRTDERAKRQFKLAAEVPIDCDDMEAELDIDWINNAEDDEICRELRQLQAQLRTVSSQNMKYKQRLLPYVQEQMAWQEYTTILYDLDKQVEQAYTRRLRVPKSKKKKGAAGSNAGGLPPGASPDIQSPGNKLVDPKPAIRALLDKRHRWITRIGPVFKPAHEMLRSHLTPKLEGSDDEHEEEE